MTTVASQPALIIPDRVNRLEFTLTEVGANFVRVWITDAPQGSAERTELDEKPQQRLLFHQGDDGSFFNWTPTKGGTYTFTAQESDKGVSTHGGTYDDDPAGYQTEVNKGVESTITLIVGERMVLSVGVASDTADLVMFAFDDRIEKTDLNTHGEETPGFENFGSPKGRAAAFDPAVTAALALLSNDTVANIGGNPETVLEDLRAKYELHRANGGGAFHTNPDADNAFPATLTNPQELPGLLEGAAELRRLLDLHMRNAKSDEPSVGSQAYHDIVDLANLVIAEPAGDISINTLLLADCWRAYEAHRASSDAHALVDGVNTATALPPLLNVINLYYDFIRQANPAAPPAEQTAAVTLNQQFGFEEESA